MKIFSIFFYILNYSQKSFLLFLKVFNNCIFQDFILLLLRNNFLVVKKCISTNDFSSVLVY